MTPARLNRLFAADGRCLCVAVDHGLFGEPSWLGAISDMRAVVAQHSHAGADAMTLPRGSASVLQAIPGPRKPALNLRADITNSYLAAREGAAWGRALAEAVERAVRLDAACVVAAILMLPGQPGLYEGCLRGLDEVRVACDAYAMPLMAEILAMNDRDGVPGVSDDPPTIATLSRQARELGADLIKTDPTREPMGYAEVIEAADGLPVLVGGGSPERPNADAESSDALLLRRTAAFLEAGASGASYGRPVVWAADPPRMTRALASVVHGHLSADEAVALLTSADDHESGLVDDPSARTLHGA